MSVVPDWNWERDNCEKLRIGDIVEIKNPGAHMPMASKLAKLRNAHWVSGIIAEAEYRNQKFEILAIMDNEETQNPVCHIIVENAIEKKLAGWRRTEYFIGGRGLKKISSPNYLDEELFKI